MNRRQLERKLIRSLEFNFPEKEKQLPKSNILFHAWQLIPICGLLMVMIMVQQTIVFEPRLISASPFRIQEYQIVTKAEADMFYPLPNFKGYDVVFETMPEQVRVTLIQNEIRVSISIVNESALLEGRYTKLYGIPVYFYQDDKTVMAEFQKEAFHFIISGNCSKQELIRIVKLLIK